MIVSAGLSPAWQQILEFDRLTPGEVNRARSSTWCASGKAINVGLALAHLGQACCTVSPLGGRAAEAFHREFAALGQPLRSIATQAATRVCTTLLDRERGQTTELVENAAPLSAEELQEFIAAVREEARRAAAVVLSGSLPAGTPSTLYNDLLEGLAVPTVLDARGEEMLAALARRPWLVKPNREELAATAPAENRDPIRHQTDALLAAMRSLVDRGARWVLVTQGERAAYLVSASEAWRLDPPRAARVVNPIGSGDCLAAGVAHGLASGWPMLESVRFGIGAAVDNVAQLLPARLDESRVRAIADHVAVDKV